MEYKNQKIRFRQIISLPFLWSLLVPLVILDIFLEIYHRIGFPLYGIHLVKRGNYVRIDRHKLKYLKWYEKIGCVYCGYANGLLQYAAIIVGITEKYWCGIMHKKHKGFVQPTHHKDFLEYGDENAFDENILRSAGENNNKK